MELSKLKLEYRGNMKAMKKIVLILTILFTSLACNLSQYLSDTPPVEWVEPTAGSPESQGTDAATNSCFPDGSLSVSYQTYDGLENASEDPYLLINQILGKFFKEASLTQSATYFSENEQSLISCAVFSPLQALERISFDFMITQPQNLIEMVEMPELVLTISDLANQIDKLGDSFAAYHVETTADSSKKAEIIATRDGDTVSIYTFIYSNSSNDLQDMLKVITAIQ
jgi:hypothetical protein